jgi:hypothetical protein
MANMEEQRQGHQGEISGFKVDDRARPSLLISANGSARISIRPRPMTQWSF